MFHNREPMALTAELVALVERTEPDPGPPPGTRDPTPEELRQRAAALLREHDGGRLWIFAYGSLIWKPELMPVESLTATAAGWHRRFCIRLTRFRGTREVPALMMALDRGGSCAGIAYRLPENDRDGQLVRLLKRETDANPATNVPRWLDLDTAKGPVRALGFVASPAGPAYAGRLPLPLVAFIVSRAAGHWGSAAQYLYNTVRKLDEHGIRDRNLWTLQEMVAMEIERQHTRLAA